MFSFSVLAKRLLAVSVLFLLVVPVFSQVSTVPNVPERCPCMIDLSTGSVNFSTKPAGSRENPVATPFDWLVRLPNGTLSRPWVVNPYPAAWHSGPPVGIRAMWINPYRPVDNLAPNTDVAEFVYSIVFTVPSPGRIYLRGGSDDPGRVFLDGVFTGINIPGYALWPSNQPSWWVLPVSSGVHNLTIVVNNSVANSPTGLLIEAIYCSNEVMATTVTVTTTTRLPGTTVTTRETTTLTTRVETTETTTVTLTPTTETQTETVMNPVNVTVYVPTTKTVPTTVVNATTVRETTTQTTQQLVVTTTIVQVTNERTDEVLAMLNMPYSAFIIGILEAATVGLGTYLVIKTKSVPP